MNPKKLIGWVLIVFLVFWLFTDPRGLADRTGALASATMEAGQATFENVIDFISEF